MVPRTASAGFCRTLPAASPPVPQLSQLEPGIRSTQRELDHVRSLCADLRQQSAQSKAAEVSHGGASATALIGRLGQQLLMLRDKGISIRISAVIRLQRFSRTIAARRHCCTRLRLRWGRVLDVRSDSYFFVRRDRRRLERPVVQWAAPLAFGTCIAIGHLPRIFASDMTPSSAAIVIQALIRGSATRAATARVVSSAYERYDGTVTSKPYYRNVHTGVCHEHPPRFARHAAAALSLAPGGEPPTPTRWRLVRWIDGRRLRPSLDTLRNRAIRVIHGAWKCHRARRSLADYASARYERVYDRGSCEF